MAKNKFIKCIIHGYIEVSGLSLLLLKCKEFNRLKNIKQLGCTSYVYPCATHSRFEHSLGAYHLSKKLLDHLISSQPELDITTKEYNCVSFAAMCHDIGHGPYSHLFEDFLSEKNIKSHGTQPWKHEYMTQQIILHLYNKYSNEFDEYDIKDIDIQFILKLIDGLKDDEIIPFNFPENKRFLFDIVSNKRNGLDIDKMDYLARDNKYCIGDGFNDVDRIITNSRVVVYDGISQICFNEKVNLNIFKLFQERAIMHSNVYQHRVVKTIDLMIMDIFKLIGNIVKINGKNLYEICNDIEAFCDLDDSVINIIKYMSNSKLNEAKKILERIEERNLYQTILTINAKDISKDLLLMNNVDIIKYVKNKYHLDSNSKDVLIRHIHYGNPNDSNGNPLLNIVFYNNTKCFKLDNLNLFSPNNYDNTEIMIISRNNISL